MYKHIGEDIPLTPKSLNISFFGNKLRVGIIGAGKGAFIKAKTFITKECNVEVLALDFIDEFERINSSNIKLINGLYNIEFIKNKHIIVIAINDKEVVDEIVRDCESFSKVYINSTSFRKGLGVIPVTRESKNMTISINTKLGNPRASIFMADKLLELIKEYDDLVEFTSMIRNSKDIDKDVKEDLVSFINSKDYEFFYSIDKHVDILKLFYNEKVINNIKLLKQGDECNEISTCNKKK